MLATKEKITNFIPQRSPMVMIDSLLVVTEAEAKTQLRIQNNNIFFENDSLSEAGLVENIAQTAAVQMGYWCALKNIPVPIGYIAAIKNLEIRKLPSENSVITTSVKITNQVLDVTVAEGRIEWEGEVHCACEMRIFVKNQP